MYCSYCGEQISDRAKSCPHCKARLEPRMGYSESREYKQSQPRTNNMGNPYGEPKTESGPLFSENPYNNGENENIFKENSNTQQGNPYGQRGEVKENFDPGKVFETVKNSIFQNNNSNGNYGENQGHRQEETYGTNTDNTSQNYRGNYQNNAYTEVATKSAYFAGLLAVILGGLGIHNFYLGYFRRAVIQVILCVFGAAFLGLGPAISWIWALVEGVQLFAGLIRFDGEGKPLKMGW